MKATTQLTSKWLKLSQTLIVVVGSFGLYKLLTGEIYGLLVMIAAILYQCVNNALIWWFHK